MGTTDDRHSRPTTTLASDELRRLAQADEPPRVPKSSEPIRRERIDTPTTQMSAVAIEELLAAAPRTSPAVIAREPRHDTVTDPGSIATPTTALDPRTVSELAAERTAIELEAAPITVVRRTLPDDRRGAIARPAVPPRSMQLPFVILGIAALALLAIALLR